jgi:hypothetical protein
VIVSRHAAIVVAAFALAACRGRGAPIAPAPETPEQTVAQFLAAVNARELDRMALLWGTERGPSPVSNPNTPEVQRRQLEIMQRLLITESHRVVRNEPGTDIARRRLTVELVRANRRVQVPFVLVHARTGGWLVQEIDLDAAMALVRPGA